MSYSHKDVFYSMAKKMRVDNKKEKIKEKTQEKNLIKEFMKQKNLTKDDLQRILGCSRGWVDHIVYNDYITLTTLKKLKPLGFNAEKEYIERIKNKDSPCNWYKTNFKYDTDIAKFMQKHNLSPKIAGKLLKIHAIYVADLRIKGETQKIKEMIDFYESNRIQINFWEVD